MATQEERDKILAEYLQAAENGEDDEEEFQYGDDDSEDDDVDDDDDDAASSTHDENYAVLQGSLIVNDEGRVVFSGTWCMKKDLNKEDTAAIASATSTTTTADTQPQGGEAIGGKQKTKKKKTKFKLKSKQVLGKSSKHPFNVHNPLLENDKPRTALFDGFFTTDETDTIQPYRKIKERDVELIFSQSITSKKKTSSSNDEEKDTNHANGDGAKEKESAACAKMEPQKFVVRGSGSNEFGKFCIEGIYNPGACTDDDGGHTLTCSKRYDFQKAAAAGTKRGRYDDSEDDYEMSDEEGANISELLGLHEDANMDLESLKKKYLDASSQDDDGQNGDDEKVPAKRSRIEEEDDDDGCGF